MTRRLRRILLRIAAVAAALSAAFGLLLVSDVLREPAPIPSTPAERPSPIDRWTPVAGTHGYRTAAAAGAALPKRWLVVGWDGADWDEILPMIEKGEMPHLARMMRDGSYGALATFRPTLSPVLWTTVATGEPPERHGIEGFEKPTTRVQRRLQGLFGRRRRVLYSNADRKVPALWDLLSSERRPVLVVGYHNTHPVAHVNGVMVSSFLMQGLQMLEGGGSARAAADRRVFPPELAPEISALQTDVEHRFPSALDRFADLTPADRRRALTDPNLDSDRDQFLYFLRFAYVHDTFNGEIAERFLPRLAPDVAFVHFQGIDFASHYYLYFHDASQYGNVGLDPSCRESLDALAPEYRRTLTAFMRYVDDWLGRLTAVLPADTAVMVLSDHGFDPVANCHTPGGHRAAPPGILVMSGPGIRAGAKIEGASLYDVFPTLAASLGLPLANDLRGHPLDAAFADGLLTPGSIRMVERLSVGKPFHPDTATPGPPDPELELRLRSLGYVR